MFKRNMECLNKKHINCTIFFDISKAFDRVWQLGLLFKMKKLNFNSYIIIWLFYFFQNRIFMVIVNSILSTIFNIETGVPQGGVLSPVLFSIFINDILMSQDNNKINSNLFADDLASFCSSKSIHKIERELNQFLTNMEKWLFKWRLEINAKKCQFIIFGRKKHVSEIKLKLFNELIPRVNETRFLGITLDSRMNFTKCVEEIVN